MLLVLMMTWTRVDTTLTNVALGKPTQQKDTLLNWYSSRAVDGRLQLEALDSTACTATASELDAWWVVDLRQRYNIRQIRIQNRIYHPERLTDFYVYVSEFDPVPTLSEGNPLAGDLCLHHPGTWAEESFQYFLQCDSILQGRYVYVWKRGHRHLTICEFEVWVDSDDAITSKTTRTTNVYHGRFAEVTPVYTKVDRVNSPETCAVICMSVPVQVATHFQSNRKTGQCECLQLMDPDYQGAILSPEVNWHTWVIHAETQTLAKKILVENVQNKEPK